MYSWYSNIVKTVILRHVLELSFNVQGLIYIS